MSERPREKGKGIKQQSSKVNTITHTTLESLYLEQEWNNSI